MPYDLHRLSLQAQAIWWRSLMGIGMYLHRLAPPRPLSPKFIKHIDTTLAVHRRGSIRLAFYTPVDYGKAGNTKRYPCIVNFHGGGFTMGAATDDARWATAVVQQADTILCSVDYRRAPEFPFPTAVEDGADAVMWIWDHAEELGIDANKLGVSGFSAGGNMAITVPLRLQDALLRRRGAEPPQVSSDAPVVLEHEHRVVKLVIAWYPATDYTRTRAVRRKSNRRPDKELPTFFTKLFDAAYLYPPKEVMLDSPYLSPGAASDELLRFLPEDFLLYTCEWDELLEEGEMFRDRLRTLGKSVKYRMIEGVRHGWDKSPNPLRPDPVAQEWYQEACQEIKRVFHGQ